MGFTPNCWPSLVETKLSAASESTRARADIVLAWHEKVTLTLGSAAKHRCAKTTLIKDQGEWADRLDFDSTNYFFLVFSGFSEEMQ